MSVFDLVYPGSLSSGVPVGSVLRFLPGATIAGVLWPTYLSDPSPLDAMLPGVDGWDTPVPAPVGRPVRRPPGVGWRSPVDRYSPRHLGRQPPLLTPPDRPPEVPGGEKLATFAAAAHLF